MAGLMNWFWDKVGLGDPEPDPELTGEEYEEEQEEQPTQTQPPSKGNVVALPSKNSPASSTSVRVSGSYSELSGNPSGAQSQVVVFVPKKYEELPVLVGHLREGRLVVTSFEGTNEAEMRYMLNFIFGAACALDGSAQKISSNIYLVAPKNVDITSNLKETLLARDSLERGREGRIPAYEN